MINFLTDAISWLNSTVFMKIPFFGSEIPWVVLWLAIPMVIFTIWFGFINLRAIPTAFRVLRGRYDDPKAPGHISQFSALTTALSGTVGLGNIAGVAVAIASGGPGAAFWMFIIGFFAMTLKCAEVTLGLKYREVDADGTVRGGPMYSLKNGFRAKGMAKLGLVLGGIYAVLLFVGAIPMVQVNQSLSALVSTSGMENSFNNKLIFGLVMAFFVGLVVIGGVKRLGRVTSILVPFMALIYLTGVLIIIAVNFAEVPNAIALIVSDAFSGDAVAGGMVGAFIVGMQRAVYSSEAGVGSAVVAHAQARTHEPASEGLVALLEPFIDTVIVCSLGAIAIVLAGTWQVPEGDISITVAAFAQISSWFPWLLTLAVLLFAHSTLCAWGFYGLQGFEYMFGAGKWRSLGYKLAYIFVLPVAALLDKNSVFDLIDSAFFLMAIPNVIALYLFAPELRRDLLDYMGRSARGEIPLARSDNKIPQIQRDTGL
ncbi:alanine/glycine:cation symporter family protein [Sphingorhabdus sp. Alg239-R122]|uniref:alanine/glycine:cation symporter family protein n=1 Tax=Sphingorhabdus sp. Alg239-R122 TaxID=2305989 RepID=UPI0013DB8A3C|nr:alanine/glycine:cation symporter family protein [Sphingorhabdus sp. Alg239-R122]